MLDNHISQPEYDQLPDTEKAGWREQWQVYYDDKGWCDTTCTHSQIGIMYDTRLVYVPVQPEKEVVDFYTTDDRLAMLGILSELTEPEREGYSVEAIMLAMGKYRQQTIQEVKEMIEAEVWEDPIGYRIKSIILTQLNNLKP